MARDRNHNPRDDTARTRPRVPRSLWTHPDQDQNDDRKQHCCGHCAHSPGGTEDGLI
jgi:hypothetical protein